MASAGALKELLELALSQCREGRDAVALELFGLYLRHASEDYLTLLSFADCLRVVGRYEDAEYEYLRILYAPVPPPYHELHAKIGMLYFGWGKHQTAEEYWEKACSARDAPGWAWIMRGANLQSLGRFENAIECFTTATQSNDACDRDEAFLNLGYIYRMQGKYPQAADAFRRALELSPDYPEAIEALKTVDGMEKSLKEAMAILGE